MNILGIPKTHVLESKPKNVIQTAFVNNLITKKHPREDGGLKTEPMSCILSGVIHKWRHLCDYGDKYVTLSLSLFIPNIWSSYRIKNVTNK